ncbi:hypothetical protein OIO90_004624 [Microbotryomycetes sp. JL221]|nr:hypothetical protein OIO90_004624 [Microbotryomycetes sp. JL221]
MLPPRAGDEQQQRWSDDKASDETHSPEAERRVLRKVDMILMPILTVSYGLQYYDKAILGSAAIFGIIEDLGLSTTVNGVTSTLRYSTASAAFYWGYIVAVLPLALVLQRLPVAKALSTLIFFWGVCTILTVVVTSYEGLVVQRVFLGLLESSVSPGFVLITGQWYTKREQATRLGIWYSATGIFSCFSGVVNYGLGSAGGPLPSWKYMYLFAGSLTILWSFVVLVFVPDSPTLSQRWFNDEERVILARRSRQSMIGAIGSTKIKWEQVREAALDPKIYFFMLMGMAIYVTNGGVTAFGARIISSFGYDRLTTIAIQIPSGAFTCVTIYIFSWLSDRYKNITTLLIPLSCLPVIAGSLIIWQASWEHRGVPLFGFYLLATFGAPYVLVLALLARNVAGGTKKAIAGGAVFIGYCAGNVAGPYTVLTPQKAIKYRDTWIALICCMGATCLLSLLLRLVLMRENTRRDRAYGASGTHGASGDSGDSKEAIQDVLEKQEVMDLTDGQNKVFRYSL